MVMKLTEDSIVMYNGETMVCFPLFVYVCAICMYDILLLHVAWCDATFFHPITSLIWNKQRVPISVQRES